MSKIFVQIASYRDPELLPTIRDCIKHAKHPENLVFGICWQRDSSESLEEFEKDERFKIIQIPYTTARGVCWARHKINTLYCDEEYTLQIDSHSRFIKNWDTEIIKMWQSLNDPKAILTSYPPEYYPDKPKKEWKKEPHCIHTHNFSNTYTEQRPRTPENWEQRTTPYRAIHVAAGFIFGRGSFIKDVTYDPEFYFSGEETALAVRLFTHGYNLFHPHKIILWHFYTRKESKKHWDDCKTWGDMCNLANDRLNCLLQRNNKYDLGIYGLGKERTLEDYQNFSGIDFKRCILHLDTIEHKEPPVNQTDPTRWSYEEVVFKRTMTWNYSDIDSSSTPRFWAFIFKDQNNQELYRKDVLYTENSDLLEGKIQEMEFEFTHYHPTQRPAIFMIWPFNNDMQWMKNTIMEIK